MIEKSWSQQDFITRIEALERLLPANESLLTEASKKTENNVAENLAKRAFERQRPLPAFHLLTTEAPGLIEGFITVVLEEEMAMRNIIKSHGLEPQVKTFVSRVHKNVARLAECVIEEFGYEPIVGQHMSNGLSREQAVLRAMGENIPIQEQVSVLAVLVQMFNFNERKEAVLALACVDVDERLVRMAEGYWCDRIGVDLEEVNAEARRKVFDNNKTEPDFLHLVGNVDSDGLR